MTLPSVAVVGGTGHVGSRIVKALLSSDNRSAFSEVRLLTRTSSYSPTSSLNQLAKEGHATIATFDETEPSLTDALKGITILINAASSNGHHLKDLIVRVLPKTSVALYLPTEFGVNHNVHDFTHPDWDVKKVHSKAVKENAPNTKISHFYPSLILEDSVCAVFGFDTQNLRYEAVGSADAPVSFTSLDDIGRAVARLVQLPVDQVPEHVHIEGDTKSVRQIASIIEKEDPEGRKIAVDTVEYEPFRAKVLNTKGDRPAANMRFLIAEGKMDHTSAGLGSDNELVNPGEKFWKWKTLEDLAKETKGRPRSRYDAL